MKKKKILSIGGGGAGMLSLITAYQLNKEKFEIITLSDEEDIYCRCTTPYVFTGDAFLEAASEPDSLMTQYGLTIVREKATSLNTAKKEVKTDAGNTHTYDYLVIATGSKPIVPPLPGLDLPQVLSVRTSADARAICEALDADAKSAVIIGSGVIGMEMAGALKSRGLDVAVVEKMSGLSPRIFDKEFGGKVVSHLESKGIRFHFDTELKAVEKPGDGMTKQVVVAHEGNEMRLPADIVILAIGVRANLDIIKNTPIRSVPHGIVVNDKMETNVKDVYACGDCCVPLNAVTGEYAPSQLASSSVQQAKIAGMRIAGFPMKYNGTTGAFAFEILDAQYAGAGLNEEAARAMYKWVVVGRAVTTDIYRDLKAQRPLEVKLIFAGPRMRLVGYEAFGHGVIASAELASFAMGHHMSILKLMKFHYISHPSMTPWPFMNPIIMAVEDAMATILKNVKSFLRLKT